MTSIFNYKTMHSSNKDGLGNLFDTRPLMNQHALITGGSRGIGAAISNALAALGANITLVARNKENLTKQAEHLENEFGATVFHCNANVTVEKEVEEAFSLAFKTMGPIEILINNAGIGKSMPFHKMDLAFWQKTLDLNLTGTFLCTKQVYENMRERGYGRIINISSTVGLRGYPYIAAYTASKHAVIGLTRTLALESVKKGITVNAICPGYTDTDLVAEAIDNIASTSGRDIDNIKTEIENMSPMGRLVTPEEVAESAAWLCLPSSASITGQAIVVSGGAVM
ncbi:MAG: SDR family NAD(P)-dependent oxidoreductase [Pseudomonadota bacterium]|nr:SDR family NAD(P)-dependent oxidoreductase [Pseudomonadota bacterium]